MVWRWGVAALKQTTGFNPSIHGVSAIRVSEIPCPNPSKTLVKPEDLFILPPRPTEFHKTLEYMPYLA